MIAAMLLVTVAVLASLAASDAPRAEHTLSPSMFGAAGDGRVDDTAALQRALDALCPGETLKLARGKIYRHTDVLTIRVPRVRVTGPGVLLATTESRSAVVIDADRVVLDGGLTLRMGATTRRWTAPAQMKLRLAGHSGAVVRHVTIDGSAAGGVFVDGGASSFLLEDVRVRHTRADGIHVTGAAHDGRVRRAVVERTGDDGVAVVSYQADGRPVRRVVIDSAIVTDTSWGRGVSVVGGELITLRHLRVRRSSAAAVYVASEGAPWWTLAPRRVSVADVDIQGANAARSVEHGAVLVYAGRPSYPPTDILVSGVRVRGTSGHARRQVGIVADAGAEVTGVRLVGFSVEGSVPAFAANVARSRYTLTGWTVNGQPVSDQLPSA